MDTLFIVLDMIFNAIGFTCYGYNGSMMKNPIKDCIRYYWIKKDRLPITKVDICGNNCTFLFISHINQLEEKIGILFINRKITKLINDEEFVLAEML